MIPIIVPTPLVNPNEGRKLDEARGQITAMEEHGITSHPAADLSVRQGPCSETSAMARNLLVYYRQNPGKLDSHYRLNSFLYGVMFSAGLVGFFTAITIHVLSTLLAARAAGVEANQLYPVNVYLLLATFAFFVCFWGTGLLLGGINRLQMIRDLLEERGVILTKRPGSTVIYLLGVLAGAVAGVLIAVFFMLVTLVR